jgi:hypothetical protein
LDKRRLTRSEIDSLRQWAHEAMAEGRRLLDEEEKAEKRDGAQPTSRRIG